MITAFTSRQKAKEAANRVGGPPETDGVHFTPLSVRVAYLAVRQIDGFSVM